MNQYALNDLEKVIRNSVWHNVFELPHGVKAFEIRVQQGYGARWEFKDDQIDFRGFLEPPMEDGHKKKWRH